MEPVKQIVVNGKVVVEVDIRVWVKSAFVLRFGLKGEVAFQNQHIKNGMAYCTVVSGQETLDKLRAAA